LLPALIKLFQKQLLPQTVHSITFQKETQ